MAQRRGARATRVFWEPGQKLPAKFPGPICVFRGVLLGPMLGLLHVKNACRPQAIQARTYLLEQWHDPD